MELLFYTQIFTRFILIIVFLVAFIGKIRDIQGFEHVINNFGLTPRKFSPILARLFLCGELAVISTLTWGNGVLYVGFGLAFLLLTLFSIALFSILSRHIQTSCNCFGTSNTLISIYDLWRNLGFILCSVVGLVATLLPNSEQNPNNWIITTLVGFLAVVFAALWMNLQAIISLFRNDYK